MRAIYPVRCVGCFLPNSYGECVHWWRSAWLLLEIDRRRNILHDRIVRAGRSRRCGRHAARHTRPTSKVAFSNVREDRRKHLFIRHVVAHAENEVNPRISVHCGHFPEHLLHDQALVQLPRHHLHDALQSDEAHVERVQLALQLGYEVGRLEGAPLGVAAVVRPADAAVGELDKGTVGPRGVLAQDGESDPLDGVPVHAEVEGVPRPLGLSRPEGRRKARAVAVRESEARDVPQGVLEVALGVSRDDEDNVAGVGAHVSEGLHDLWGGLVPGGAQHLPLKVLSRGFLHHQRSVEVHDDDPAGGREVGIIYRLDLEGSELRLVLLGQHRGDAGGALGDGCLLAAVGLVQVLRCCHIRKVPQDVARPQPRRAGGHKVDVPSPPRLLLVRAHGEDLVQCSDECLNVVGIDAEGAVQYGAEGRELGRDNDARGHGLPPREDVF
mmetsp:Transcript_22084/g.65427  ORF Transcript_22084/g.65427 Transcript_22084/m.65427 type:complete len:439 (+) Transcript_22084:362-1678(+)